MNCLFDGWCCANRNATEAGSIRGFGGQGLRQSLSPIGYLTRLYLDAPPNTIADPTSKKCRLDRSDAAPRPVGRKFGHDVGEQIP